MSKKNEFPETVTNPDLVRGLINAEFMKIHPLRDILFVLTDSVENFYKKGDSTERKRFLTTVTKEDVERIEYVYKEMAWNLSEQICNRFFGEVKEWGASKEIKNISGHFVKWSEAKRFGASVDADPIQNLKDLCASVKTQDGYKLHEVFVNLENFYEFWDHIDTTVTKISTRDSPYGKADYLPDLGIWLIGVDEMGLPEGSMVGVCTKYGAPQAEFHAAYDSKFGNSDAFLPLSVRSYRFDDEAEKMLVEAWVDFRVHIRDGSAGFYLEDVI